MKMMKNEDVCVCVCVCLWMIHKHSPGNLVAQRLGGDDGNLLHHTLVGLEVQRQAHVVLLNDEARSLLDGFGSHASPVCVCVCEKE